MSVLFTPFTIKNVEIKNRFVRSATYEGMGTANWLPSDSLVKLYNELTDGEVGLIVTGAVTVERPMPLQSAEWGSMQAAIDDDRCIDGWRRLADVVKSRGSRIVMQLYHPGRRLGLIFDDQRVVAPSAIPDKRTNATPRALSVEEIQELVEKFAQAILRSRKAGFDGVQLQGCHGVLISDFISPFTNVRTDQYGGSTANRARFVVEILQRARELVGSDYPLLIKMNCDDFVSGGLEITEAKKVASILADTGIDCIEVTGGIPESAFFQRHLDRETMKGPEKEGYFRTLSSAIKGAVDVPVILVGGLRTPSVMERVIAEGMADLVALSRPLIREPDLVKLWKAGDTSSSSCVSCNKCYQVLQRPLRCYMKQPITE
jgi:2,4-dienoyl-CoA reductase-like NADH-dependent reductase (Old Yellow Enzyme family)